MHKATTCAHFILNGENYRQFFHPSASVVKKWRAHVSLPRLAWEVQPKVNGLPRSLPLLLPLGLGAGLAPSSRSLAEHIDG